MEINVKNYSSRLLLERADNGLIIYDVDDEGVVQSKILYEIYYKDGLLNLHNIILMLDEIMENLQIPFSEEETNRTIGMAIIKLDPDKPSILDENESEDDE